MASIHRQTGRRYWYAAYRDAEGRQHFLSTKILHSPLGKDSKERATNASTNRRLAMETALRLEETERGNPTESHLRKLVADISERVCRRRLEFKSVSVYLNDWLARTQTTLAAATHERYKNVAGNFLTSLGPKEKAALADITAEDVQKFIEHRLEGGRNPSTVRTDCKILNAPFAIALRQGLILHNPVGAAEIPEGAKESRTPFSPEQVGTLLSACDDLAAAEPERAALWREWKTCILIGFYTGLRLGDVARLAQDELDSEKKLIKLRPKKTSRKKRDLIIPIHPQLENHIRSLQVTDGPSAPLCPTLAKRKVHGKYGLSLQFHELLAKASIKQETVEPKGPSGHCFHRYTYHSLRHSCVSAMANEGVATDLRKQIVGHSEDASHLVYTHINLQALRKAILTLPSIT